MGERRPNIASEAAQATIQARRLRVGAAATLVVATALSAVLGVRAARQDQTDLALTMARSFFDETVALRSWVSDQGGLYAPLSEDVPPNPFLPEDRRELVDEAGDHYVMLNPAYLTRLLAARTESGSGVSIRLIADPPLNPDNTPDPWEADVLRGLDAPGQERHEVVGGADGRFRYLGMLEREPSCVDVCHPAAQQRAEATLGAISVGLDHAPFAAAGRAQVLAVVVGHAFVLAVALAVLWLLGRRLEQSLGRLRAAGERIGALERLLPICAWCKKIRPGDEEEEEEADWVRVEDYIADHVETEFTHGMCPDCATKMFRDGLADRRRDGPW